jgi:adenine-specific DNA-methyltransferase
MESKKVCELIAICKERGVRGYSGKKKTELIQLLTHAEQQTPITTEVARPPPATVHSDIRRLNYIGSKYQLLDWITTTILSKTGWDSLEGHTIADLFAGTGVVSYHFRCKGAAVVSNDAERYSAIIAHAFTRSIASEKMLDLIKTLQEEIDTGRDVDTTGVISEIYAINAATGCQRQFFTSDNARRIDYLRKRIEELRPELSDDEHAYILSTLLLAADAVSNVPAVYGCYLKSFKARAQRSLFLTPIHNCTSPPSSESATYNESVIRVSPSLSSAVEAVYLDPPYNSRHYSKNYFPLNVIATPPSAGAPAVHGKTGIPDDCYLSPFSGSPAAARTVFEALFSLLRIPWIFLSYSNEGTLTRAELEEIMGRYGTVSVLEREHQRFKSFEYNETGKTKEYLFCLHRTDV